MGNIFKIPPPRKFINTPIQNDLELILDPIDCDLSRFPPPIKPIKEINNSPAYNGITFTSYGKYEPTRIIDENGIEWIFDDKLYEFIQLIGITYGIKEIIGSNLYIDRVNNIKRYILNFYDKKISYEQLIKNIENIMK